MKIKINNLLSAEGINPKKESLSSNKALERVLSLPLLPLRLAEARVLVYQIRSLSQSISELEELLEKEGPKLAGHENLISIKGIGSVSAAVLLSAIGRIEDFADAGKLAAYLGLVPRVQNSNETERSGRITKQGNKLARLSCSVRWSALTYRSSINESNVVEAGEKQILPWRVNSWESSITPSTTSGCSLTSPILSWPPKQATTINMSRQLFMGCRNLHAVVSSGTASAPKSILTNFAG